MTIRMFKSTDRGAPLLTGVQGKMGELLLATLVQGFPATSIAEGLMSSTGAGNTAVQVNMPGNNFVAGQSVTVSGANEPEYNGTFTLTAANSAYIFYNKVGTSSYATGPVVVAGERTAGTTVTSMTRVGTTVTVVLTGHGFVVNNRARVVGANEAQYNGVQKVATVTDANTFTFELPAGITPTTPATGTITCRYGSAGLGWTQQFTGTNKKVFQQGSKSPAINAVLLVDETDASYHTYGAGMIMYEAATSLTAFTGLFYTTPSLSFTGMFKSGTADTVAHPWVVIGDSRTCIILTKPQITGAPNVNGWDISYFGDIASYLPGDTNPQISGPACRQNSYYFNSLATRLAQSASLTYNFFAYSSYAYVASVYDAYYPIRMSRNHLAQSGCIPIFLSSGFSLNSSGNATPTSYMIGSRHDTYSYDTYPDPVHAGFNMEKLYVKHGTGADGTGNPVTRGELRGLWNPSHRRSVMAAWLDGDTIVGTGELAGRTFDVFESAYATSSWCLIETSDTWGA